MGFYKWLLDRKKDSEHKIMLSNGDSVISGSGVNNQVALFNSTKRLDSDGNLTFDGSNLRVAGTKLLKT